MNALLTLLLFTAGEPPAVIYPSRGPQPVILPQRVVVAAKTFRSGDYHAGHNCPNCGREQKKVSSGIPNVPGHTHACPACRLTWTH